MKCVKHVILAALIAAPVISYADGLDKSHCTYNGIPLRGKVQFVTAFADIKVQEVNAFADLNVQKVNAFADSCGKWEIVTAFPDFTVQLVSAFGDLKVSWVSAFPGVR
ncbi:hypothetical protein RAS12_04160 [Achromobacter seleniivolatilans]|uniref:7(1) septoil knot domain-containing protein n=1 Tax=Achromobacter seleniivolatilans TaxID=3047478 RepID=A0ABY9M3J2_9BURK|nr:hypothetical protein [Achromobacter sp. R39]WMD21577.1 hypothetical protein RAS12_04160 [Achromobacter sp. R39]